MTPGARIEAAAGILDSILDGIPAEKSLTNWARKSRFAGSKDRAAVRDHVFDALRCRRTFAAWGGALTGRGLMIGLLRAQESAQEGVPGTQGATVADIFSGQGYGPAVLTEEEEAAGGNPQDDLFDIPDWMTGRFHAALGDEFASVMETFGHRAPLHLRVNLAKTTRQDAQQALLLEGIDAHPIDIAETALEVTEGARKVARSDVFLSGQIEIQDGASQAAVAGLPLTGGMRVVDYCAGGGGKLLAMAARINGQFSAFDIDPARMRDIPERTKRAGVSATIVSPENISQSEPYDLVFCDAPCSGSGTWRRTPDAKWRLSEDNLAALTDLQLSVLNEAAPLVAEGGVLAYATCSLFADENQAVVDRFVAQNDGWQVDFSRQWTPAEGADGFFIAHLMKR